MNKLVNRLSEQRLAQLRAAYDRKVMNAAMLEAIAEGYPALLEWNQAIGSTFYASQQPLAAKDRERCMIALLTQSGPPMSLAIHVYWGLMEGLSVEEICHVAALAACYAGVSRLAVALPVIDRTLGVLAQVLEGQLQSTAVLRVLVDGYSNLD
jgi:alkylhydroperoxidase/carboxymuconolactone decarboxylase family protein YurZ